MYLPLFRTTSAYILRCSSEHYICRRISLKSLATMNCNRNDLGFSVRSQSSGNSTIPHDPNSSVRYEDNSSNSKKTQQGIGSEVIAGSSLKQPEFSSALKLQSEKEFPPLSGTLISKSKNRNRNLHAMRTKIELSPEDKVEDVSSAQVASLPGENSMSLDDESSLPTSFGKEGINSRGKKTKHVRLYPKDCSEGLPIIEPFDICQTFVGSKPTLHVQNKVNQCQEEHTKENSMSLSDESSLPTSFGENAKNCNNSRGKKTKHVRLYPKDCSEGLPIIEPFDICQTFVGSKPTLHVQNKVNQCQEEHTKENSMSLSDESSLPTSFGENAKNCNNSRGNSPKYARVYHDKVASNEKPGSSEHLPLIEPLCQSIVQSKPKQILRPGMVLLKSYIRMSEQIEIVKKCRELGLGSGGFYCPSYHSGAKLRLQMMCLGLNWDVETRKYDRQRSVDGSEAHDIPLEFKKLVESAIQDSHALIKEDQSIENAGDILPCMCPDICIVNFYTTSGRLGLHQDRDESKESLCKGLPVVSFSIGESAEFLYGDKRDVDKAERVELESGDVLIFGGMSRHIFHGVASILPDSAPVALLEEAKLRPGRLNLTFRQY